MYTPGTIIGQDYVIERLIGKGGMGVVYEATHRIMQQRFAVKVLSADQLSEQNWMRFQREAQALARLNHQNIVKVYNLGIDRERYPYYVMELLSGETLQDKIRREGSLMVGEALDVFIEVAEGLAAAHRAKIIHRDIKPGNIMLSPQIARQGQGPKSMRVLLVDFGLARLGQNSSQNSSANVISEERSRLLQNLTEVGEVFGSPLYMSPEQTAGTAPVDERSDIYSFGCSLFETLTGRVPFQGRTVMETFSLHQNEKAPSLQETDREGVYPLELELAVARMLEKSPEKRYQNMESLLVDLRRVQEGKPVGSAVRGIDRATTGGEELSFSAALNGFWQGETSLLQVFSTKAARIAIAISSVMIVTGVVAVFMLEPKEKAAMSDNTGALVFPDRMKPTEGGDKKKDDAEIISNVKLISRKMIKGGALRFTFPGESFAPAKIAGRSGKDGDQHCQGEVIVKPPLHTRFSFAATPPEFLMAFEIDDIDDFSLSEISSKSEWQRLFRILSSWKNVKRLDFRDAQVESKDELLPIDKFEKLNSLEFKLCRLNADCIKDLKALKRVSNFTFDYYKPESNKDAKFEFAKLFEALSGSSNLHTMQLAIHDGDQEEDLTHLRNLPNLSFAIIKGTTWTEKKIDSICALSGLKKIVVHNKDLAPDLVPRFQKSSSLDEIVVEFALEPNHLYDRWNTLRNRSGGVIKIREEERQADWEEEEKEWQKAHPESLDISF